MKLKLKAPQIQPAMRAIVLTLLLVDLCQSQEKQIIKSRWSQEIVIPTNDRLVLSRTNSSYAVVKRDDDYYENKLVLRSFGGGRQKYMCTINLNYSSAVYTSYDLISYANEREVFSYDVYEYPVITKIINVLDMKTCAHKSYYSSIKENFGPSVTKINRKYAISRSDSYELFNTNLEACQHRPCMARYNLSTEQWGELTVFPAIGSLDDNLTFESVVPVGKATSDRYLFVVEDRGNQSIVAARAGDSKLLNWTRLSLSMDRRDYKPRLSALYGAIGYCYVLNETKVNCLRLDEGLKPVVNVTLDRHPESYYYVAHNREDGGMYVFSLINFKEVRLTEIRANGEVQRSKQLLKEECLFYFGVDTIFFEENGDTCMRIVCRKFFKDVRYYKINVHCF